MPSKASICLEICVFAYFGAITILNWCQCISILLACVPACLYVIDRGNGAGGNHCIKIYTKYSKSIVSVNI